ncbi:MAG: hypothetical protein N2Z60_02215 [Elusimicrobiales bacterium]|nr:hypothetical protein [Elusimicrobiales bacterium]HOJ85325.1 hypothetical protein [Elusimicrobiales bacterium]HOL61787.1 hypothetical protein [Elusimicrobiales bacterium]HPO96145.1 hypothetical protein [Elusimicrobiales bacterium]
MKYILALFFTPLSLYAQTVLFIGDSHSVGPFGKELDALLRREGYKTYTYASCGSISEWWFSEKETKCGYFFKDETTEKKGLAEKTPDIEKLLKEIKPDYTIIELGANYKPIKNDEFIIKDISKLVDTVLKYDSKCLWVTNPDSRKLKEEIPRVKELINFAINSRCEIFDSTKVTKYPEDPQIGDGLHYSNQALTPVAINWAREVFDFFKKVLKNN